MRRSIFVLIGFAVILLMSGCLDSSANKNNVSGSEKEAAVFDLKAVSHNRWRLPDAGIEGRPEMETFYLRREIPESGDLFIKSEFTGLVFSYSPATRRLTLVDNQIWERAGGNIHECPSTFLGLADPQQKEYTAVLWKSIKDFPIQVTVNVSGRFQWGDILFSPSRKKLAVFSFDGPYTPQNFLTGRGQIIKGLRHLDLFEVVKPPNTDQLPEGKSQVKPISSPIVIKDSNDSVTIQPCWTPEEDFIIITDDRNPLLWVADVRN